MWPEEITALCKCGLRKYLPCVKLTTENVNMAPANTKHNYKTQVTPTLYKALARITLSKRPLSYGDPKMMFCRRLPENTQACWDTYATLPFTDTLPEEASSSPSMAISSEDCVKTDKSRNTLVSTCHN